jgi:hypothetical protein
MDINIPKSLEFPKLSWIYNFCKPNVINFYKFDKFVSKRRDGNVMAELRRQSEEPEGLTSWGYLQ